MMQSCDCPHYSTSTHLHDVYVCTLLNRGDMSKAGALEETGVNGLACILLYASS